MSSNAFSRTPYNCGVNRLALLCLTAAACAEVKNQVRLGIGGSGNAYAPKHQPDRPNPSGAATVAQSVGMAIGAAAISRATGGCIAACPPGTSCNAQTGLCDTQPCRGRCEPDEVCENDRCVPVLLPGLIIKR